MMRLRPLIYRVVRVHNENGDRQAMLTLVKKCQLTPKL